MPIKRGSNWFTNLRYKYQGRSGRIRLKVGPRRRDAVDTETQIRAAMAAGTFVLPEDRVPIAAKGEQVLKGPDVEPAPSLFVEFAGGEFLRWSKAKHSPGQHKRQKGIIEAHLAPHFDGLRLDAITPKHIDDYLLCRIQQRKRQVKPATVNRELMCLKSIFRKAIEYGYLATSPAARIPPFKEAENPPRLLEQREIAAILRQMPDQLRVLVALAAYAGMRLEEACNLKWSDVDLKVGEMDFVGKGGKRRRVPISDDLRTYLIGHPRRLGSPYVCPNSRGKPYSDIRGSLNSAVERAGISDHVTLHQFRHAFSSYMQMLGVSPHLVQKWLGHKSLKTTQRYSHVSPEYEKEAIQRVKYREDEEAEEMKA